MVRAKVLLATDGYTYGGKPFDRRADVREIIGSLPTLSHVVHLPYLNPDDRAPITPGALLWEDTISGADPGRDAFRFEQVPFASMTRKRSKAKRRILKPEWGQECDYQSSDTWSADCRSRSPRLPIQGCWKTKG